MKRLIFAILILCTTPAFAEVRALLLSLEQYNDAQNVLAFVDNDIKELSSVLTNRLGVWIGTAIDSDIGINDTAVDRYQKSILKRIDNWLKQIGDQDIAIIYIAGHGIKDANGKLYWAMNNFDPKNFAQTAIPVALIREKLESCRAAKVLLFIDACYAGTTKAADSRELVVTLANSFKDSSKVTTIASSSENQKSMLWMDMQHSLFTFWLIQAFKGAADNNGDGIIHFSELRDFLDINVEQSARMALDMKQTPTYINAEILEDFAFPVQAVTLKRLYEDIADQIDIQMRLHGFKRLAITEFSSGDDENAVDVRQTGLLTKDGAREIMDILRNRKRKFGAPYTILTENATSELLKNAGITFKDIGTSRTKNLRLPDSAKEDDRDIPAVFTGNLRWVQACGLRVTGRLISTEQMENVIVIHGLGRLGEPHGIRNRLIPDYEQLGMCGLSMFVPPYNVNRNNPFVPNAQSVHPLNSSKNEYVVKIFARPQGSQGNYNLRTLNFDGNRCDVQLNRGEQYMIQLINNTGEELFARVLVDGRSTIAQYVNVPAKGVVVEAVPENETLQIAPRVNLRDARFWFLAPNSHSNIYGFYAPEGLTPSEENYLSKGFEVVGKSQLCRFNVVDANESLAVRDNFTDQLGIITVAVYEAISLEEAKKRIIKRGSPDVGTNPGKPENANVTVYNGKNVPGDPKMIVNIHYSSK